VNILWFTMFNGRQFNILIIELKNSIKYVYIMWGGSRILLLGDLSHGTL
jgi:hypothetical protein